MHVLCMPYKNNYTLFNPKCQCMYCVCPATRTIDFLQPRVSAHVLCIPNNNNYTLFNRECQCMYCVCPTRITILYSSQSVSACTVYAYNNNNNYTLFNPECQRTYCVCPTTRTRTILYSTQSVSACTLYALKQEELCFIHLRVSVNVLCMPYNKNNNYNLLNPECLCMYCVCPEQ